MKVACIGLGHMGAPMRRNILAAGHDLVVHDLRRYAPAVPSLTLSLAATPSLTAPQE